MLKLELPAEVEKILARMSEDTGHSMERIAYEALLERLEDWEDIKAAEQVLRDGQTVGIPLEEVMRKYGLKPDKAIEKPAAE